MQSIPRSQRTIAGRPPSPEQLDRFGILGEFSAPPAGFDCHGDWVNLYRLVTCHGYVESGNETRGFLRIARKRTDDKSFELKVEQRIVEDTSAIHRVEAEMLCSTDATASLRSWSVRWARPNGV